MYVINETESRSFLLHEIVNSVSFDEKNKMLRKFLHCFVC